MTVNWKKRFVRLWIAASIFWVSIVWVIAVPQVYKSLPEQLSERRIQTSVEFAEQYFSGDMSEDFQLYYLKLKQRGNILDIRQSPAGIDMYDVYLQDKKLSSYAADEDRVQLITRLAVELNSQWHEKFRQLSLIVALFVVTPPLLLWTIGFTMFWLLARPKAQSI